MKFIPREESRLVIDLPGERLMAVVQKVVDEDTVIVHLDSVPMAKSHNYRKGDVIACRRRGTDFGLEVWRVVEQRRAMIPPKIEEKADAADAREKPRRDKPKHPRDGRKRPSAKTSRGRGPVKRKAPSKVKRRSRG